MGTKNINTDALKSSRSFSLTTHGLLLLAMLLWASAFVGIRVGLRGYSPGSLALLRYLVASFTMIPLYLRYRTPNQRMNKSEIIRTLIVGVFGIGIYNIALNYGEISVSAAVASFIVNQSPVLIAIFAVIFLKERLNYIGWTGFFISCVGIFVIAFSEWQGISFQTELIYIIIATIIAAVYTIMQKPLLVKFNGVELTALIIWSGTAVMLIFTPRLVCEIKVAPLVPTLTAAYMGIFPGVIAYTLWGVALARTSTMQASSYLYLLPILTTLVGWIFIGEIPLMLSFIGGLIALAGSVVVQLSKVRRMS